MRKSKESSEDRVTENERREKVRETAVNRYSDVMKCIVRRYIMAEQKKQEDFGITEDDVNEIRRDINKFRYTYSTSIRYLIEDMLRDIFIPDRVAKSRASF